MYLVLWPTKENMKDQIDIFYVGNNQFVNSFSASIFRLCFDGNNS